MNCEPVKTKNLDMEFRRILAFVKPHVQRITNNHYLMMYRFWLEKLSKEKNKEERNRYLQELCRQICRGILMEPFTEMPLEEILLPFDKMLHFIKFQKSEIQKLDQDIQSDNPSLVENNLSNDRSKQLFNDMIEISNRKPSTKCINNDFHKKQKNKKSVGFKINKNRITSKLSTSKIKNIQEQKQRSIYVVQNDIDSKQIPQHVKFSELNSVPEEGNLSSSPEEENFVNIPENKKLIELFKKMEHSRITFQRNFEIVDNLKKTSESSNIPKSTNWSSTCFEETRIRKNVNQSEGENSWSDFSDISSCSVKMGSGDGAINPKIINIPIKPTLIEEEENQNEVFDVKTENEKTLIEIYENKMSDMMELINFLKQENAVLTKNVETYEKQIQIKNKTAEISIHNLSNEVTSLKDRLQELSSARNISSKQNDNEKTSKFRNIITSLRSKNENLINKNENLKDAIDKLKLKIDMMKTEKEQEISKMKEQLIKTYTEEIEELKRSHLEYLKELEKCHAQKFILKEQELNDKIEDMKKDYEQIETEIKENYQKSLHLKDVEIGKLENMIQEQCLRMQNEVKLIRKQMEENANLISGDDSNEKIVLQNCIFKMEKLFKKSQKEYTKQIIALKKELEIKNKALEMRLSKQPTDQLENTISEKKADANNVLMNDLEEKYKQLLGNQYSQMLKDKERVKKTIADLREQVIKLTLQVHSSNR